MNQDKKHLLIHPSSFIVRKALTGEELTEGRCKRSEAVPSA
jgi:hypothetical protein